jgi:hypothetical protein
MFRELGFVLLLVACSSLATRFVAAQELTAEEKTTLASGKEVKKTIADNGKDRYFGGTGMVVVPEPVEAVWAVIQDYAFYPKMFSNTYESKEMARLGGKSLIRMKLGHPIVSVRYHLEMSPNAKTWTLEFKQVSTHPSDLEDIRGYWKLVPMGEKATLLMYVIGVKVPDGIVRILPEPFKVWVLDGVLGAPSAVRKWMEGKTTAKAPSDPAKVAPPTESKPSRRKTR